ncbi:hypothetical protein [Streptomyces sp. STR69]|uniref:hypothetical protein n=1 Tax=Streptomyces sp. STR69 TaxID=1796942 RepID=UPI0021C7FB7B|nr:hypothetical protein [Streptomyces sp. STR69]
MDGGVTSLIISMVGVAGTLGGSLLTQYRADQTKRMELRVATEQQREGRLHAETVRNLDLTEARSLEALEIRRACYIGLNIASRRYMTALVNLLHALLSETDINESLEELEARRIAHRDSYAEAQMIVPQRILVAAAAASRRLNEGYGTLKHLALSSSSEGEMNNFADELQAFEQSVTDSWGFLSRLRQEMREELGVDPTSHLEE